MFMAAAELDHSSGVPLYRQIMNILRVEIAAGEVSAQEPLTEAKLEARFGVSLAPIKQALKELTTEGVVYRKQGRGTFPAAGAAVDRPADLKTGDLYRFLADRGLNPTSDVFGIERVTPPAKIADRLGLTASAQVLHFTRHIAVDEKPLAENDIYIAGPVGFEPTEAELKDGGSALALLEQRHGIVLDHAEHEAWATSATAHQAKVLDVPVGAPVLVIDTVFYARGGDAVGWRSAVHRPEEFKFHFVTTQ
jgi:GntR family transcriptional regulator